MPERVTEEMISAYIDDELGAAERARVEQALAESPESRRMYDELMGLRNQFQSLPQLSLPADFHRRVLERIEQRRPDRMPAEPRPGWKVFVGGLVALAALLLGAVLVNRPWESPAVVVQPPEGRPEVGPDEGRAWAESSFVYFFPGQQQLPAYSLVVDVAITRQGQANEVFATVLRRAGIEYDPDLVLDNALEETILGSRLITQVRVGDADADADAYADAGDTVEIVYVVCELMRGEEIMLELNARRQVRDVAAMRLDMVAMPQDQGVLYQVNEASRRQFARRFAPQQKRSLAHRLVFTSRLGSTPAFLGRIPSPKLDARVAPAPPAEAPMFDLRLGAPGTSAERTTRPRRGLPDEQKPAEILFVLRHLPE